MNRAQRLKILTKLAQTQTTDQPTETEQKPTVPGSPNAFQASSFYPTLNKGWGTQNARIIDGLINVLNTILYYSSNGQVQMTGGNKPLSSNNFQIDESAYGDPMRKILLFSKTVFKELLNSKNDFAQPLPDNERRARIARVKADQSLNSLPTTNPTGQLGTKLPSNAKTLIITYLDQLR